MCSNPPPPRKAKATMNCRAPIVYLVTVVPVSCLDTAAVPRVGGNPPPDPPPQPPVVCSVTVPVSCLDTAAALVLEHSSRAGGGTPPLPPPPRARPLVLGDSFFLVLRHSRRAGGDTPPGHPPSSTPPCAGTHIYLLIFNKKVIYTSHSLPPKRIAQPIACEGTRVRTKSAQSLSTF